MRHEPAPACRSGAAVGGGAWQRRRVQEIWTECLARHGGPFLFGAFGGADAMYGPVVHRFRTYAIEVTPVVRRYMETMQALPAFQEWTRDGLAETIVIEKFETV